MSLGEGLDLIVAHRTAEERALKEVSETLRRVDELIGEAALCHVKAMLHTQNPRLAETTGFSPNEATLQEARTRVFIDDAIDDAITSRTQAYLHDNAVHQLTVAMSDRSMSE